MTAPTEAQLTAASKDAQNYVKELRKIKPQLDDASIDVCLFYTSPSPRD